MHGHRRRHHERADHPVGHRQAHHEAIGDGAQAARCEHRQNDERVADDGDHDQDDQHAGQQVAGQRGDVGVAVRQRRGEGGGIRVRTRHVGGGEVGRKWGARCGRGAGRVRIEGRTEGQRGGCEVAASVAAAAAKQQTEQIRLRLLLSMLLLLDGGRQPQIVSVAVGVGVRRPVGHGGGAAAACCSPAQRLTLRGVIAPAAIHINCSP